MMIKKYSRKWLVKLTVTLTLAAIASAQNAPQIWEVFVKDGKLFFRENGKDFELKRAGKNKFAYEQGEVIFLSGASGKIEHIFTGLYAARKTS
jgi:hypothetical protein